MLSDKDIYDLIKNKKLVIEPFNKKNLGCASIDLSLGSHFIKYKGKVDTHSKKIEYDLFKASKLRLKHDEFLLATTNEKIKLANGYYGLIETRGNFARAGISVTCDDGHIDPGTDGLITLEIKNNNNVDAIIYPGDLICQLFLFKLSSNCIKTYQGKYQNQKIPTIFKR